MILLKKLIIENIIYNADVCRILKHILVGIYYGLNCERERDIYFLIYKYEFFDTYCFFFLQFVLS